MYLLDTDTLTHLHARHPRVIINLCAVDDPIVRTTIVTKAEILRGRIDFLLKAATPEDLLRAAVVHALGRTLGANPDCTG